MQRIFNTLVLGLALTVMLPSCVSKKKFDALMDEKSQLAQSLAETQEKVKMLESELASLNEQLEAEKTRLNGEISNLKSELDASKKAAAEAQQMVQAKEAELAQLRQTVKDAIGATGVFDVAVRGDQLMVVTATPLTYRSGSTRVSKEGREAIKNLAEVLKNNPDVKILVEGHTDDVPMKEGAPWRDNWELSTARAMRVVRMLIKEGVNPAQVAAVSKGEYDPVAEGKTEEARAQNRRTEFVPAAKTGTLYQAVEGKN